MTQPTEQPMPTPNGRPAIQDLVTADMVTRKEIGIQRYGTPLQAHNGRDALRDAYEEALDLTVYLRQVIEERDGAVSSATRDHTAATEPELCAEHQFDGLDSDEWCGEHDCSVTRRMVQWMTTPADDRPTDWRVVTRVEREGPGAALADQDSTDPQPTQEGGNR